MEGTSRKRKRGAFIVQTQALPDLVTKGVVSEEEAAFWFRSYVEITLPRDRAVNADCMDIPDSLQEVYVHESLSVVISVYAVLPANH